MKMFNGKAIYNPSGKAQEYSYWACNFYVGCSNGCTYCYCKKGMLVGTMGQNTPSLKKCFKNEEHAIELFTSELETNKLDLQKHGLFFSFTTDPMLKETKDLTFKAVGICLKNEVPVKILTKMTYWVDMYLWAIESSIYYKKDLISFGFTITGHDELEPKASTNTERVCAMIDLSKSGFKTFASFEPIINLESTLKYIKLTSAYCDLFKIGLESGRKYDEIELVKFMCKVHEIIPSRPIYWKESFLKQAKIDRFELPGNCVNRDFLI